MPLTGDPSKDIKELTMANKNKGKKRSKKQIVAIALSEERRKAAKSVGY